MQNILYHLNPISFVKKIGINKYTLVFEQINFELQQLLFKINNGLDYRNHLSFNNLIRFKTVKSFIFYSNESAIEYIKTRDNSILGDFFIIDDIKVISNSSLSFIDIYVDVNIPNMSYDYNDFEINNKQKVIPTIVSLEGKLYLIFIIEDVIINRQDKIVKIKEKISKFDANTI
jgi:hypothetical protein